MTTPIPEPAPTVVPAPAGGDPVEPVVGPNGFPLNTPWRDMQPEHQSAYWRTQAQKHETEAKTAKGRIAELEPKAKQVDDLTDASRSEQEKAVAEAARVAREQALSEATQQAVSKYGPQLVGAEFRVALAGRMTSQQVSVLVGGLNVGAFLADDGTVDAEKVAEYITAIPGTVAADIKEITGNGSGAANLGQGKRPVVKTGGLEKGRSLYAEMHPPKAAKP